MVDILVIGVTGFCGRHAARYVLDHPERSKFTVGLAARSRSKIASIGLPTDDSVQIFELDILDEQAVESVVKQAKVVLNCIGPFWNYGTPVVWCVMPTPFERTTSPMSFCPSALAQGMASTTSTSPERHRGFLT